MAEGLGNDYLAVACTLSAYAMDARFPQIERTFAIRALSTFTERHLIRAPDSQALTAHATNVIKQRLRAQAKDQEDAAAHAQRAGAATAATSASGAAFAKTATTSPKLPQISPADQAKVDTVCAMGFPADQALFAFLKAKKILEAAIELLLTGGVPEFPYGEPTSKTESVSAAVPSMLLPVAAMSGSTQASMGGSVSARLPSDPANAVLEVTGAGHTEANGFYIVGSATEDRDEGAYTTFEQIDAEGQNVEEGYTIQWYDCDDEWTFVGIKNAYRHTQAPKYPNSLPPQTGWTDYHCSDPFPQIRHIENDLRSPEQLVPTSAFLPLASAADDTEEHIAGADPQNDFELLVRRMPAFLEAQFNHERGVQSKHLGQTAYFQALCDLAVALGLHQQVQLAVYPSLGWLRGFDVAVAIATSFVERKEALPMAYVAHVQTIPMFKLWAPRILKEWGTPEQVFCHDRFGESTLQLDAAILRWYSDMMQQELVMALFPAGSKWKHGAFEGTVFTRCTTLPTTPKWACVLEGFERPNIVQGGGCRGRGSKNTICFKSDVGDTLTMCVLCMYHGGQHQPTGGAEDKRVARAFATAAGGALSHIPAAVLHCRAALVLSFFEHVVLAADLLPALISAQLELLSAFSALIPLPQKSTVLMKNLESTNNASANNRPNLSLNRLGIRPLDPHGHLGLNGVNSIFAQVMRQMEACEKEIPGLWLRPKRLFKVQSLAGEGIDDAGGGYYEMISHIMTELAVDNEDKSGLPLLLRTPNGRVGAGINQVRVYLP